MRRRCLVAKRKSLPHAAALSDRRERRLDIVHGPGAFGIGGAADIEREANESRDGVGSRSRDFELADRCHKIGLLSRPVLDRKHHFGRSGERIVAHRHRHGAGMPGDALDLYRPACHAVDRGHNAQRQPFLFQHRALLDVYFDVADGPVRRTFLGSQARWIAAEIGQRLTPGNGVFVELIERFLVERAGQRPRSAERRGKAHALFVAEGDHLDGEREPRARFERGLHHFDRRDHPKRSVEPAGIADAVDVGAEHQRLRSAVARFVAADDAGQRIDTDRHPGVAHPIGDKVGGAAVGGSEIKPREPPGLVAQRGQLGEPVRDRLAECRMVRHLHEH
jgi:hypothetical protein